MTRFWLMVGLLVLLVVGFVIGALSQAPALMLSYLCLSPIAGILVGRASIAIGKPAILSEEESLVLQQVRNKKRLKV